MCCELLATTVTRYGLTSILRGKALCLSRSHRNKGEKLARHHSRNVPFVEHLKPCNTCDGTDLSHSSIYNGLLVFDNSQNVLPPGFARHQDVLCLGCATIEKQHNITSEMDSDYRLRFRNAMWLDVVHSLVFENGRFLKKEMWISGKRNIALLQGNAVVRDGIWQRRPLATINPAMRLPPLPVTPPGQTTKDN